MPSTTIDDELRDLRMRRRDAHDEMKHLLTRSEKTGTMSPEDVRRFDAAERDFDAADAQLRVLEKYEPQERTVSVEAIRSGGIVWRNADDEVAPEWRNADGSVRAGALVAEARAISTGAGLGQVLSPTQQHSAILAGLEARSVFLAAGPVLVGTDSASITFPHEVGDTAALADWVAEGAEINPVDPGGEGVEVTPRKVAALVKASNESLADSNPAVAEHVENRLLRAMALKADLGFFEGTGTAPQIRGLANVSGIQTVDMGATAGAAPTNLDPWAEALGGIIEADADEDRVAIFMHGRTWKDLLKLKEQDTGSNKPLLVEQTVGPTGKVRRSIYGRPVYLSSQLATDETHGTATDASASYVVDMSRVLVVVRQNSTVALDRSAAFSSDSSMIRGTARLALYVPDAAAVARVEGIIPAA